MPENPPPESSPLRVALLGSFPPQRQGIPRYCGDLARALARRCQVTALGFRSMYPAFLFPGTKQRWDDSQSPLTGPRLNVSHHISWYNPFSWIRAAFSEADIAHIQWWSLPLFPVLWVVARVMRWRGKPVILTVHNILPHERSMGFRWAGKMLYRQADRIIVHTTANQTLLSEIYGLPTDFIEVIPMAATAIAPLSRESQAQQAARRKLRLPEKGPILLFAGTIRPYKGLHLLLEAFAMSLHELPEATLVIAGKPWESWTPYAEQIARLDLEERVYLQTDFIPESEWLLYFQAADVLVLPYTHLAGQSHVAAWALACDLPLLTSRIDGLTEWVAAEEICTFPTGDIPALQAIIRAFFSQQTQRAQDFSAHAKKLRAQTAWPEIARQHEVLYRRCIASIERD